MSQDPQAWNQQDETVGGIPSGQFYVRAADTNTGTVPRNESVSGIPSGEFYARAAGTNTGSDLPNEENSSANKPQTDAQPASKGKNNNLNKALIGGLVGATLGTLAAALANKRTAQAANHATKGVGKAVKSVSEGVNHAAKGIVMWNFPTTADILNVTNALAALLTTDRMTNFLANSPMTSLLQVDGADRVDATIWDSGDSLLLSIVNLNYGNLNGSITVQLPVGMQANAVSESLWGEAHWITAGDTVSTNGMLGLEVSLMVLQKC